MALQIWDGDDLAAAGADDGGTDDLRRLPIAPLGEKVRLNSANNFERGLFREKDNVIDRLQRGNEPGPLRRRNDRAPFSFISAHRGIAVDRHDQHVGPLLDPLEGIQMADVEDVEAAVGKRDLFSLPPEFSDNRKKLLER